MRKAHELHPATIWLTPTQAAKLTGYNRNSFRRWASAGLVRAKENPRRGRQERKDGIRDSGWLYHRRDIEKNILGYDHR